jgi:hypothetical protein
MTSPAALAANRVNAARSTGPRTAAGKAAVARNALRHGLSLPVLADATLAADVSALAERIAGEGASEAHRAAALAVAEAQVDVLRVRRVREAIMAAGFGEDDITMRLMRLDRYERRALSRRKAAIKAFDALDGAVVRKRRRNPWVAVAAAAGLRGFWQNRPDFGAGATKARRRTRQNLGEKLNHSKGRSYPGTISHRTAKRRRSPWAAVAAFARVRGPLRPSPKRDGEVWQNKPDRLSARREDAWIPGSWAAPAPRDDGTEPQLKRLRQRSRPLHTRPIGRTMDARPVWPRRTRDRRHWAMVRRSPSVPAGRTTPAHAAPSAEPAAIPAGAAPSAIVPAVAVASPIELNRLHGRELIGGRPQVARMHHGGMRAHAGHCTDDGERRGQCHAEFTHCMFPFRVSGWAGWNGNTGRHAIAPRSQHLCGARVASRSTPRHPEARAKRASKDDRPRRRSKHGSGTIRAVVLRGPRKSAAASG